jgi:hypothetical protein
MKMRKLLVILIALTDAAFGQGLCPGSSSAPDKDGILAALQQIGKLIPPANSGAKLSLVDLETQGVCQYQFLSPEKRQKLVFVDFQGTIRLSATVPMTGTELGPLPGGFVDLPEAIAGAQRQGIQLPLDSAKLMMAQPRGKPPVAVWTLTPRNRTGRVLSYFVSAADPGHALQVSDVTDYISDYNEQMRRLVNIFHPPQTSTTSQATSVPIEGQSCTCWNNWPGGNNFVDPMHGKWGHFMGNSMLRCLWPSSSSSFQRAGHVGPQYCQ